MTVPGNITPGAEFNFFVDPDAADAVLCSGIPITLVPLDVTRRVRLERKFLTQMLAGSRTAGDEIHGCISSHRAFRFRLHKRPGEAFMDDN